MGVLKVDYTCAEVRYWREDNFGASSFISAALESKTQDLDYPCPAKETREVSSEISVKF